MTKSARLHPRERLFVYGTLRPRKGHPMGRVLAHNALALGPACMRGHVCRAGPYPAVEAGPGYGWVHGELFEITGGREIWRVLDRYEGCDDTGPDYARQKIAVYRTGRRWERWTTAWCYVKASLMEPSGTCDQGSTPERG